MQHEKKIKVVMLSTDKPSTLATCTILDSNKIDLCHYTINNKELFIKETKDVLGIEMSIQPQHLYFLSDEEIKGEDIDNNHCIFYPSNGTNPCQAGKDIGRIRTSGIYYKVIATTNPELKLKRPSGEMWPEWDYKELPRPSDSFIQKYVEEYNKGNIIEEVMVEYRDIKIKAGQYSYLDDIELKVAPDNTITIKQVVETWDDIQDKYTKQDLLKAMSFFDYMVEFYNPPTKKK